MRPEPCPEGAQRRNLLCRGADFVAVPEVGVNQYINNELLFFEKTLTVVYLCALLFLVVPPA